MIYPQRTQTGLVLINLSIVDKHWDVLRPKWFGSLKLIYSKIPLVFFSSYLVSFNWKLIENHSLWESDGKSVFFRGYLALSLPIWRITRFRCNIQFEFMPILSTDIRMRAVKEKEIMSHVLYSISIIMTSQESLFQISIFHF